MTNLAMFESSPRFWSRVSKEVATGDTAFKPLVEAGAVLSRHDNTAETAQSIVSQLVMKKTRADADPEGPNSGMKLGATSAGAVITEESSGGTQGRWKERLGGCRRCMRVLRWSQQN